MEWIDNDKKQPTKSGLYLVLDNSSEGRTMNTLWYDKKEKIWNRCVQPLMWQKLPPYPKN